MQNNSNFSKYIKPVIVLVVICLVISAALAATYGITNPIIEKRAADDANAARRELLKEADTFDAYDGKLLATDDGKVVIEEAYVAKNGAGMVFTVGTKSFGGTLTEMVGVDAKGAVTGIVITGHADTPGVGTKAMTPEFLGQYKGLTELTDVTAKKDANVNHITGASITSNAVHYGVYMALQQYQEMGGVQ